MEVRTRLGWPWRILLALLGLALVGGMWWWGFDFGQLLGGFNQRELETRLSSVAAEAADAQRDAAALRTANAQLESDIAMMRGLKETMQRQQSESLQENARLKEELAFFQQFFADASKSPGVSIHRIDVDTGTADIARYSVLLIRGGGAKTDFDGSLALQAQLVPGSGAREGSKALTVVLPDERPQSAAPMKLRFKYYQRLEGTFAIPPGYQLRALTARAYESGVASPRASRTLTFP